MLFQRSFRLLIGVAVVAASVRPASADPMVIRSGSYLIDSTDPSHFSIFGDSFGLGFSTLDPVSIRDAKYGNLCISCLPGDVLDFNIELLGLSVVTTVPRVAAGTNVVNGILYPQLVQTGDLVFTSGLLSVPAFNPSDPFFLIEQPFTFSGHLTARDTSSAGPPVFDSDLVGGGTVRTLLRRGCPSFLCTEPQPWFTSSITYTFADPVPEPRGMILVASGLLIIASRRKRIRSQDLERVTIQWTARRRAPGGIADSSAGCDS